jgi:hypothetical protein
MIGLLAALVLATSPEARAADPSSTQNPGDFDTRMRASAAAAEALQGPLDGSWALRDASGGPLYVFEITDPAGGTGPTDAAWRDGGASSALGMVTTIARQGGHLLIVFTRSGAAGASETRLTRRGAGLWTGWLTAEGRTRPVMLVRAPIDK